VLEFRCGWVGVVSVLQAEAFSFHATVFLCFIRYNKQHLFSHTNITLLVFVMKKRYALCEVEIEYLCTKCRLILVVGE